MAKKFFRDVDAAAERVAVRAAEREKTVGRQWTGKDLEPDEVILWRGRSKRGFVLMGLDAFVIPFSIFWAWGAWTGMNQPLPLHKQPGMLHNAMFALAGFYILVGRFFVDALYRSRLTYLITDRRVMIINGLPGLLGGVRSYDRRTLKVELQEHSNGCGTIKLKSLELTMHWFEQRDTVHASLRDKHRLFRIRDAREVHRILTESPVA